MRFKDWLKNEDMNQPQQTQKQQADLTAVTNNIAKLPVAKKLATSVIKNNMPDMKNAAFDVAQSGLKTMPNLPPNIGPIDVTKQLLKTTTNNKVTNLSQEVPNNVPNV